MRLPRLARASLDAVLVIAAVLSTAPSASANLTTTGSGTAAAALGTFQPPTSVTVPSNSTGNVNVTWTASTGLLAPTG